MENVGSAPGGKKQPAYTFGRFRLEPDGTLFRGEAPVELSGAELAVLRMLLARQGSLVTQSDMRQALGRGVQASAETVAEIVASLRRRLGPDEHIQTLPRRAFRFAADALTYAEAHPFALPHIAILPLAGSYGVAEYMGAAVAEGAVDLLRRTVPAVCSLAAQESVITLARRGLSALEIGRALHADMVLSGTLRAGPAHDRMRVEMVQVMDGAALWTDDILVERSRVAGLEIELANTILMRLEGGGVAISASAGEGENPASEPHHREAWHLYQRARYEWQSLERHRMQDAVQQLKRASDLDPALTAARVDLAHLAITEAFHGYLSPAVAVGLVRQAAKPGFQRGSGGESMLVASGWVSFHFDRDMRAALHALKQTEHLPHDPWVTRVRVMLALSRRRFEEAAALLRDAIALDPYAAWLHARLAWTHHLAGDHTQSLRQIEAALEQFPGHEGTELYAGIILAFNGEAKRAVEIASALAQRRPYFDPAAGVHAYALAVAGQADVALSILERLEWMGRERYALDSFSPAVYVTLGEEDKALAGLAAANDARCPWFFQVLADPRLRPLQPRAEFLAMQRILAEMEQQAHGD